MKKDYDWQGESNYDFAVKEDVSEEYFEKTYTPANEDIGWEYDD